MKNTSQEFTTAIQGDNRDFIFSMTANGNTPISNEYLLNGVDIIYVGMSERKLSIGQFCKSECNFEVTSDVDIDWKNSYIEITIQLDGVGDIIPLGKYWVNNVKYNSTNKSYSITAFDVPSVVSQRASITDYNVANIITQFETLSGMQITNKNIFTLTDISNISESDTWQDLIGYIAGYDGYNIRADREGNLEAYKFTGNDSFVIKVGSSTIIGDFLIGELLDLPDEENNYIINPKDIFEGGLETSDLITINSIVINNGEETLAQGSGYGINYSNPYIKDLHNIAEYYGKTYTPMDLSFRGNPAIEIGDIIYVEDAEGNIYSCYVMEYELRFDGGLKGIVHSYASESIEKVVPISPTDKKIEQAKESINTIVDGLMNGSGYFNFIDQSCKILTAEQVKAGTLVAGWQISDSETVTETTKGWRFILGGLYHSSDGFQTYDTFALDSDGNINASAITTGVLKAIDIIGSNISGTKITFGEGKYSVTAKGTKWTAPDGSDSYGGIRFYGDGDFGIKTNSVGIDAQGGTGIQITNKGDRIYIFNKDKNDEIINYILLAKNGKVSIYSGDKSIRIYDDGIILMNGDTNSSAYLWLTNDGKVQVRSNGVVKVL